jgi:hypothetical protein
MSSPAPEQTPEPGSFPGIARFWDEAIVPALIDYIRIPAKSPHFDKDWSRNGHIDKAVELAADCAAGTRRRT